MILQLVTKCFPTHYISRYVSYALNVGKQRAPNIIEPTYLVSGEELRLDDDHVRGFFSAVVGSAQGQGLSVRLGGQFENRLIGGTLHVVPAEMDCPIRASRILQSVIFHGFGGNLYILGRPSEIID